jgi:hypothetical protein
MAEARPFPRRLVAGLLVAAVVLANAAFIGLGSVFDYPDVLQEPAAEILASFREDEALIITFFVLLACSAALLAPIAVLLGRQIPGEVGLWSKRAGIAAAVVQVLGLMRWPLVVPFLADRDDTSAFEAVHTVLGTIVGETIGYALTAVWTVLIVRGLARYLAGSWFAYLGYASAALIALGVLVPLDAPGADFANFLGYVIWSLWLLAFAWLLWRRGDRVASLTAVPGHEAEAAPAGA